MNENSGTEARNLKENSFNEYHENKTKEYALGYSLDCHVIHDACQTFSLI